MFLPLLPGVCGLLRQAGRGEGETAEVEPGHGQPQQGEAATGHVCKERVVDRDERGGNANITD